MGTRALYTFTDEYNSWNVYKHWDGYPEGAAGFLENMLSYAWALPRFEADECACAFIAANKRKGDPSQPHSQGGDLRLMPQGNPMIVAQTNCADIEYRYVVMRDGNTLYVKAYEHSSAYVDTWSKPGKTIRHKMKDKIIFSGSIAAFIVKYFEAKAA